MRKTVGLLALAFFVLGFAVPSVLADSETWAGATKDKWIRGIENGVFGLPAELYHHIDTQSDEGIIEGWTVGLVHGLHRGTVRTLVGAYELATPFFHDEPVLTSIDTIVG